MRFEDNAFRDLIENGRSSGYEHCSSWQESSFDERGQDAHEEDAGAGGGITTSGARALSDAVRVAQGAEPEKLRYPHRPGGVAASPAVRGCQGYILQKIEFLPAATASEFLMRVKDAVKDAMPNDRDRKFLFGWAVAGGICNMLLPQVMESIRDVDERDLRHLSGVSERLKTASTFREEWTHLKRAPERLTLSELAKAAKSEISATAAYDVVDQWAMEDGDCLRDAGRAKKKMENRKSGGEPVVRRKQMNSLNAKVAQWRDRLRYEHSKDLLEWLLTVKSAAFAARNNASARINNANASSSSRHLNPTPCGYGRPVERLCAGCLGSLEQVIRDANDDELNVQLNQLRTLQLQPPVLFASLVEIVVDVWWPKPSRSPKSTRLTRTS